MKPQNERAVTVAQKHDDGTVDTLHFTAEQAREVGRIFIREADEIDPQPRRVVASRWRPGHSRDIQLVAIGMLMVLISWLGNTIVYEGRGAFEKVTLGTAIFVLILSALRLWVLDRRDIEREEREAYHGPTVDAESGELPWTIIRDES